MTEIDWSGQSAMSGVAVREVAGGFRVFVSSTMQDLPNERRAVVAELNRLNVVPVNAEDLSPTGEGSWTLLEDEIASSDLVVLILGDRYGWVPKAGPHAGEGVSVTELEYRAARAAGIRVVPFFKRLPYGAPRMTSEAKRRDQFRDQVGSWDGGGFKADFEFADDLAAKVGEAVVKVLVQGFRDSNRGLVRSENSPSVPPLAPARPASRSIPSATVADAPTEGTGASGPIPTKLIEAVASRSAVLFAGAGMSLQAGLPSAHAFTEAMLAKIRQIDASYERGVHGGDFNSVASDLQLMIGTAGLRTFVSDLMGIQEQIKPLASHALAVNEFDLIATTNYDTLFERADRHSRLAVVADELEDVLPTQALVKLHGTLEDPAGLVITEEDLLWNSHRRRLAISAVGHQMATRPVVVVGSSLRDPSTRSLFDARETAPQGWCVAPAYSDVDEVRLRRWNLTPIHGLADSFIAALGEALSNIRPDG